MRSAKKNVKFSKEIIDADIQNEERKKQREKEKKAAIEEFENYKPNRELTLSLSILRRIGTDLPKSVEDDKRIRMAVEIAGSPHVVQAVYEKIIQKEINTHQEIPNKKLVESQYGESSSNYIYDDAVYQCLRKNKSGYVRITETLQSGKMSGQYQIEFLESDIKESKVDCVLSFADAAEKKAIRDFLLNPPCKTAKDLQARVAAYEVYKYDSRDFRIPGHQSQHDIDHAKKLLDAKKAEALAIEAYNKALSTDPKPNNISELYLKATLAKLEYRKMVYEDRAKIELDISPCSAKKKLKATVELIECVNAMLPAAQSQIKPICFPDSSAACDGTLGKLRNELLKYAFSCSYEKDVKHCKTNVDLKKLSDAALKLKKVISGNEIKITSGSDVEKINARIAILEAKLEYRKALYEIRVDNKEFYTGITFFRSAHASAKMKLENDKKLFNDLQDLKLYQGSGIPVVTVSKDAGEGELGKLCKELKEIGQLVMKEKSQAPLLMSRGPNSDAN